MISPVAAHAPHAAMTIPHWHRPLLWLAVVMGVLAAIVGMMAIVDPRDILGQNAWFKPLKFALSIGIYSLTLAWMLGQFTRWRRVADWAGTVTAGGLVVEIIIIVWAAAAGTTSHFNIASALSGALWSIMGASIAVVWLMAVVVAIVLSGNRFGDPARMLALRAGVIIGLAGMAVAFFMVSPTEEQLSDFQGIAGAHAVGVADGGPGLPFLGWSTEGGDLRAPHFVGMHALQLLPLLALLLELGARRWRLLRDRRVRFGLVVTASVAYAAWVALLTVQALGGQSVVAPSPAFVIAGSTITGAALVAVIVVLLRVRREVG